MLIRQRRGWEMPEREATPEAVFFNRRTLLAGGAGLAGAALAGGGPAFAAGDPTADLYPAKRNEIYKLDRAAHERNLAILAERETTP